MGLSSDACAGDLKPPDFMDFGLFVLAFQPSGKVIIASKNSPRHLTLQFGGKSGVLDAHLTEGDRHEPLGGIRGIDLGELVDEARPTLERNLERLVRRVFRRVRLGWLAHHGILAFPLIVSEAALLGLGRRRGRRWKIDPDVFAHQLVQPLSQEQLRSSPEVAFLLFRRHRDSQVPYGALFKFAESDGRSRYAWFRSDRLLLEMWGLWRKYEPLVRRRLIGPSEIAEAIGQALANKARVRSAQEPGPPQGDASGPSLTPAAIDEHSAEEPSGETGEARRSCRALEARALRPQLGREGRHD